MFGKQRLNKLMFLLSWLRADTSEELRSFMFTFFLLLRGLGKLRAKSARGEGVTESERVRLVGGWGGVLEDYIYLLLSLPASCLNTWPQLISLTEWACLYESRTARKGRTARVLWKQLSRFQVFYLFLVFNVPPRNNTQLSPPINTIQWAPPGPCRGLCMPQMPRIALVFRRNDSCCCCCCWMRVCIHHER